MEEEIFDESQLFSTFDSVENGDKNAPLHRAAGSESAINLSELDSLKQENVLLKKLVRKIGLNPSEDKPLANILFYNGACSQGKQGEFEDFISHGISTAQHQLNKNSNISGQSTLGRRSIMSDGFAAALGQISDYTKLDYGELDYDISALPMACIQYFTSFCLDRFGSDMERIFPSPPSYDRVYFKTLPADTGSRISQRRKQVCFNCDGDHRLNECSKRRDLARISMKRKEFLQSRNDSRYHEDQAKDERYQHLAPGKITEKLREALNMVEHDLPPFIYRMRMLRYPPGWLPGDHDSGIVLYGKEGKEEQNDESNPLDAKYVHFPGFNVSVPRACKDLAYEVRLPVMQNGDQLNVKPEDDLPSENESHKRSLPPEDYNSPYQESKRVRTCSENDMDVEDNPPGTTGYIETGQSTNNETERLASTQRTELEDGEIAESPGAEQGDAIEQQSWWMKMPLVKHFKENQPDLVAPPFPLTPLPLHKISQILPGELNHISFEDRSRWLDPVFGNLQVRTGRYDKLKTILAARENKRKTL